MNEFGCKVCAESCIVLKNGDKYYVDNSVDNIKEQMQSSEDTINVELSKIVSKGKKISIQRWEIEEFHSTK